MPKTCILDVGANSGDFLFPVAARSPSIPVIGIEPIPELFEGLGARREVLNLLNVELQCTAIDTAPRSARFNVARHADWGVSSLLEFDRQSLADDEYWALRSDLYFDESIDVKVVRLDALLEEAGYDHISFIKIDAQGVDLRVLESLGKLLPCVDAGMLEAPTTCNSTLYQGEPSLHEVLTFLDQNGFEPYAIKSNDPACAEVNVFFNRRGVDWREMETSLNLRGVPLYDGKHYWHIPSSSPEPPPGDPVSQSVQQEIDLARHYVAENRAAWSRIVHWQKEVSHLQHEASELTQQLAQLEVENASLLHMRHTNLALRSEIEAMHRSMSWKATAPLRALKKLIRK
jgi:FkbM family methyltransferase